MVSVDTFTTIVNQLLPEPHAGLLAGILFGTKATLSKDFIDSLTKTGTLHIVALSGMNITILGSLIDVALLRFVSRRIASLLTVLIIIGFVWFVGAQASIVRAAIMGCLALLATIFGRQTWSLLAFILTVGIMLLFNPAWLFELSFQLSALATLGIILFGKTAQVANKNLDPPSVSSSHAPSARSLRESEVGQNFVGSPWFLVYGAYSLIKDDLRITLAAQVFTIPLIFFTFHRISLISPLTNILIGFIIPPLTGLGLATAVLGWIFLPLGQIIAWVCWLMLQYLFLAINWTAKIPLASIGF
jgi:competence protein ComEC